MKYPTDYPKRLDAIRDAYRALTEEQKREVSVVACRFNPRLFEAWSRIAATGYHNCVAAAKRPPGVGRKLDDVLLNSEASADLLREVTTAFFTAQFPGWVSAVGDQLQADSAFTVESKIDEVLTQPGLPFCGQPYEALFRAFCRRRPASWLKPKDGSKHESESTVEPASEDRGTSVSEDANIGTTAAKTVGDEIHSAADSLNTALQEVDSALARARTAKTFDIAKTIHNLEAAASAGAVLRRALETAAKRASKPTPEWASLDELKTQIEVLDAASDEQARIAALRERLQSLRVVLESLIDIGSKTAKKRERVEGVRQGAVSELGDRIKDPNPPTLPGDGSGDEWFALTFGLAPKALDGRLEQLRLATLPALAAFIEEVEEWARFRVQRWPSDQATTAEGASTAVVSSGSAVVVPKAPSLDSSRAGERTEDRDPTPQSATTVPSNALPATLAVEMDARVPQASSKPATSNAAVTPVVTGPVADTMTALGSIASAAEKETSTGIARSASDERSQSTMRGEVEQQVPPSSDGIPSCADTLVAFDANEDLRMLLPDIVACQSETDRRALPPLGVWEILTLLPWLNEAESEVAQRVRGLVGSINESGWLPGSTSDMELTWAAVILPAFVGSTMQGKEILSALPHATLPAELADFTRIAVSFFNNLGYCTPEHIRGGALHATWRDQLAQHQASLREFCDRGSTRTITFQKATRVLQALDAKGGYLRNIADRAQGHLTAATRAILEADVRDLKDPRKRDKLIEKTTRAVLESNYSYIEGAARAQLDKRVREFGELAERLCAHLAVEPQEAKAVTQKVAEFRLSAVPSLKLFLMRKPSVDGTPWGSFVSRQLRRSAEAVLALFESTRYRPIDRPPPERVAHLARLRVRDLMVDSQSGECHASQSLDVRRSIFVPESILDTESAFHYRLKARDIENAQVLLSVLPAEDDLRPMLDRARDESVAKVKQLLKDVRRDIYNARTLSVVTDSDAQQRLTKLENVKKAIEHRADFAIAFHQIESIHTDLREKGRFEREKLEAELAVIPAMASELNERISSLLRAGDLATAREYIVRVKVGQPLPPLATEEDVGGFSSKIEESIISAFRSFGEFPGFLQRVRNKERVSGRDFGAIPQEAHRELLDWLEAWEQVHGNAAMTEEVVKRWLSGLRLSLRSVQITNNGATQIADVEVDPVADRSVCGVPAFGSEAAGRYRLIRVSQRQEPAQLVQLVATQSRGVATILLVRHRVDRAMRLEYARLCRDRKIRGLLVDELLVSFLAGFETGRLNRFFRATLPFTWVNPYLPTSSYVPPELFFGRLDAVESLLDTTKQRCFVYGGRQLGKTALLREVARRFHHPKSGSFAVWIDLQAEEFGRESEPEEIWSRLERRLKHDLAGFEDVWKEVKQADPARRTETALLRWLEADASRRFLLMLDEADSFVNRDALRDFNETRRLKGLMDRTNRRIKVVFAGLHNVQRSAQQANHPLAHLGTPINIGAFTENGEWMEAYALIVSPLAALGFSFESVDLPSRVLTACNFYPSLVQQFGYRLLERMRTRPLRDPPYLVTSDAVDAVLGEDEFRQFMVERFQWTLALDPRYYHLAYGYAWLFQEEPERAAAGLSSVELRRKMEEFQPDEFSRLRQDEFETLLDEMRGLGIFQSGPGEAKFRLRNTNILLLLGEPADVLSRLIEKAPDLRLDYQSETYRGRVTKNGRRWLTRPEENRLFDQKNQMTLIAAVPLAQSAGLGESLRSGAPGRSHYHAIQSSSSSALAVELARLAEEKLQPGTHVVYVEPTGTFLDDDWLRVGRQFVERRTTARFFSLVYRIPLESAWTELGQKWLASDFHRCVFARRWEDAFVGPWLQEQDVVVRPDGIGELRQVTDGWPKFLQQFTKSLAAEASWEEALAATRSAIEQWLRTAQCRTDLVGNGTAAESAWKGFQELYSLAEVSFDGEDLAFFAELHQLPLTLLQHRVDLACRLDILERRQTRYHWTRLLSRALAAR